MPNSELGMTVDAIEQVEAQPGEVITLKGRGLSSRLKVQIDGKDIPVSIEDSTQASFVLPEDLTSPLIEVSLFHSKKFLRKFSIVNASVENPLEGDFDVNEVCDDTIVVDSQGKPARGKRICDTALPECVADGQADCLAHTALPAVVKAGLAAKLLTGTAAAGVDGTALIRPADCALDGELDCVTVEDFPAVDKINTLQGQAAFIEAGFQLAGIQGTLPFCTSDGQGVCLTDGSLFKAGKIAQIHANDIRVGSSLAGVSGTLNPTPSPCAADGSIDCLTNSAYPAVDKIAVLQGQASQFKSSLSIAGVSGTLADCSSDGQNGCVASAPNFAAALLAGAAAKIRSAQSLAGVTGTAPLRPTDCAADGATDCVTIAAFPAVRKSDIQANTAQFSNALSIIGISGSMTNCAAEGATSCLAVTAFPATDKAFLTAQAGKILDTLTLAGVSGTLASCSSDAQTDCLATSNFPAMNTTAAETKIMSGQTLAGVAGTVATKPADCANEGSVGCVAVLGFPAMSTVGASAKILSGQSIAGVNGSLPLRPADCASDGSTGCVTVSSFPAIDLGSLNANPDKIKAGLSFAGVSGTLADCGTDGEEDCVVLGPNFASMLTAGANAKILNGQTLGGINGNAAIRPANCSVDGGVNCVSVAAFPAVAASTAPGKIVLGQVVAGIVGTVINRRPSDCASDAEIGCTTVAGFPALEVSGAAAKIALGDVLAGVVGAAAARPSDCAADAATGCVAVANYPAIDAGALLAAANKIKTGVTITGVSGTLANCSSDGALGCVSVAAYPAAIAAGSAAKILTGQSVAGIAGSAALKPVNCSADAETSCVTHSNFPSIDKAALTANAGSIRSAITIASVPGTLNDCAADGAQGCVASSSFPAANSTGAAAKILTGQSLAAINGTGAGRPADCNADAGTNCVAVSNFLATLKSNITSNASKIRSSLTLGGVPGTMADCAADGLVGCYTVAGFPAAESTGAAAKILTGQSLAGVAGTAPIKPGNCSADSQTNCVTVATFPSVDKGALTASAAQLHSSLSIAGVSGTLADCSADGGLTCMTVAAFPAANTSGAAAKILTGQTLGGVAGSALIRPADCSTDAGTNCVTVANYPATNKSTVTSNAAKIRTGTSFLSVNGSLANCSADNQSGCVATAAFPSIVKADLWICLIKNGTVMAGLTGSYPSSSCHLADAEAYFDLDALFTTRIASGAFSGWFDRNGTYHKKQGSSNIAANAIKGGVTIFGATGTIDTNCSSDGQVDCKSTSTYKTVNVAGLSSWDIRAGKTVGGVAGNMAFYQNRPTLSTFNRTTGAGASTSTTVADFYDTLDDRFQPTESLSGSVSASISTWLRDSLSDNGAGGGTASNLICDGTEDCVYMDQNNRKYWARSDLVVRNWEPSIDYCEALSYGTYTDWRLPTQKEAQQAYIDGIQYLQNTPLRVPQARAWTSTTQASVTTNVWSFDFYSGLQDRTAKASGTAYTMCTRP